MNANWIIGEVVENKAWTNHLYSLYIKVDLPPFEAGQFGRLALTINGEEISRPYSFANSPQDPIVEFYYIHVPGGALTTHLVDLKAGDSIGVHKRIGGIFTLQEVPDAQVLWLLATGTALGAFLSMLGTPQPWQRFEKIILVHAVRHTAELTHQADIQKHQAHDQFMYIPFVSREVCDFALSGRVTQAISDGRLEEKAGMVLSPDNSHVMICGNPHMVKDSVEILMAKNFRKNLRKAPGHITIENYWKES